MRVIYPHQVPALPNAKSLKAYLLYRADHAEVIHLSLGEGESVARHPTPVDVFFLVLEGTGWFDLGEESAEASREALVDCPPAFPTPSPTWGRASYASWWSKSPHRKADHGFPWLLPE